MKEVKDISEAIKEEALRLGFADCGFSRAEALTEDAERLKSWKRKILQDLENRGTVMTIRNIVAAFLLISVIGAGAQEVADQAKATVVDKDEQRIQELTDKYVKNVDDLLNKKEEEIMHV